MTSRIIVGAVALLLALIGGALTVVYANDADARAIARLSPVQVLVVTQPIAAGTPAESIAESLALEEIPQAAVVPGALADLSTVEGQVTTADLQPGEQLLGARFAAPEAVSAGVEMPPGMHRLSVQLEPRRVIGGELRPGDTVGFFVSRNGSNETSLILHKVLVLDVVGGVTTTVDEAGNEVEQPAAGAITVTFALSLSDAELVVYAAEYDNIWLSIEAPGVPENGSRNVTPEVILE